MELTHEMLERLEQLEQKYAAMGQDMESYLDGLLYADYMTYWDYIRLDTLLSLQSPETPIPDENIFIIYHQITELYFKLSLLAIKQIRKTENLTGELFKRQIQRVNRYFSQLIGSFDIMVDGMDKDEFLKFRMSLLPASGFQSVQYRMIEFVSADLSTLVHHTKRSQIKKNTPLEDIYQVLYWKSGATELATGKKTLTLKQFEEKYSKRLLRLAFHVQDTNIWQCFKKLTKAEQKDKETIDALRQHDFNANILWPLSHYRSAVKHLDNKPDQIEATGGTNWQKYLPPKNQRIIFYPELWTDKEIDNWGKKIKF